MFLRFNGHMITLIGEKRVEQAKRRVVVGSEEARKLSGIRYHFKYCKRK